MAGKIIAETERLLLREFTEDDTAAFFLLGSDPTILRFTGDPGVKDIEHAREVLRSRPLADYRTYGFGRWACVLKATGTVIGFSGLKYLQELNEVDIGYRFLPAHWGCGLATEAGRAALEDGFTRLKLGRIIGLVDPKNSASVRVLTKLGLNHVGEVEFMSRRVAKYVLHARGA
jgi:ribosomal-protein-alanine N-acetyltransferase